MVKDKKDGFAKVLSNSISKIKEEGKERENKYDNTRIREAIDKNINRSDQIKYNNLKLKENIEKNKDVVNYPIYSYNQKIKQNEGKIKSSQSAISNLERKERYNKVMNIGSKVETRINVALENITQKLGRALSKKVISKKVFKPQQMTANIKEVQPENVFHDKSRFFKQELEETKKSLFFS